MCPAVNSGRKVGLLEPQVLQRLRLTNDGDEMIRGTFASFALGAAVFSQGGLAHADPSILDGIFDRIIVAQATAARGAARTSAGCSARTGAACAAARASHRRRPRRRQQPGVTQLPPVKVTPETAAPKTQARPRVTQQPRRREAAPARAVQPAARPVAAPAPQVTAEAKPPKPPLGSSSRKACRCRPVKGSEIPLDKVPSAVAQVTSARDRSAADRPRIEQAIQQNVPGAIISDVNGNRILRRIFEYRGFTASPVEGTPQGLAVYQNGVRINEVFGDTVNWDLIPSTAINSIAVVSGNPLYGLNALGGALNITMKDGFGFQGVESDTRVGSYGRFQEYLQLGKQVDNFAAYAAVEGIWDQGWRQFSPSEVRRACTSTSASKTRTPSFTSTSRARKTRSAWSGRRRFSFSGRTIARFSQIRRRRTTSSPCSRRTAARSCPIRWTVSGVAYVRSFHQQACRRQRFGSHPLHRHEQRWHGQRQRHQSFVPSDRERHRAVPVLDQKGRTDHHGQVLRPERCHRRDRPHHEQHEQLWRLATGDEQGQALRPEQHLHRRRERRPRRCEDHEHRRAWHAQHARISSSPATGSSSASPLDIAPVDLKITTNYYGLYFSDSSMSPSALTATVGGRYNYEEIDLARSAQSAGLELDGQSCLHALQPDGRPHL